LHRRDIELLQVRSTCSSGTYNWVVTAAGLYWTTRTIALPVPDAIALIQARSNGETPETRAGRSLLVGDCDRRQTFAGGVSLRSERTGNFLLYDWEAIMPPPK
jgi:hypothetical protein